MVIAKIAIDIAKLGIKSASKYYRFESKAFSKLYTGFPKSRRIGLGVRHGLTAGSIAGTFINTAEDTPGNGTEIPYKKSRALVTPRKSYQTRQGYTKRDNCRNNSYRNNYQHSR